MHEPRSAGEMGAEFPYMLPTLCYIEVARNGEVTWGDDAGTYARVRAGESRLYAVWPGKWSSHLFVIDDFDQYARAKGLVHDPRRTGLSDHEHQVRWSLSPYESKPDGSYVTVDVWLDCGCTIRDLKVFAAQMRAQRGWDVATSAGRESHDPPADPRAYSIRARRRTLT